MLRSTLFSLLFIFIFFHFSLAQHNQPDPRYKLITGNNYVQSKNYYLLTLFQQLPEVKKMLAQDPVLGRMGKVKVDSLNNALKICARDGFCYTRAVRFTDTEIRTAGDKLKTLYQPGNALGKLVKEHLIPSGAYILFQQLPAAEMLEKAWIQDAEGINFAIGVYAEGKKPNYPLIDSISFATRNPRDTNTFNPGYLSLLYNTTSLVALENKTHRCFTFCGDQ